MTEKPEDKIIQIMRDSTTGRLTDPYGHKIRVNGSANIVAGRDIHLGASPRPDGLTGAHMERTMSDKSDGNPNVRSLEWRVQSLEIACDQLRQAVVRSIDLTMAVARLANVQDKRSSDLIFREINLAINEIRAMAPIDRPLANIDSQDQ